MGAIIESPGFLPYLSGFANLKSLNALRRSLSDSQIREKMEEIGLDSHSRKSVRKYSLGMKQKLGILQATMEDQKILLLDEPMNGLDKSGVGKDHWICSRCGSAGKIFQMGLTNG